MLLSLQMTEGDVWRGGGHGGGAQGYAGWGKDEEGGLRGSS